MAMIAPSNDFSGQALGLCLAVAAAGGLRCSFTGPLKELRETLLAGFTQAGAICLKSNDRCLTRCWPAPTFFLTLDAATAAILSGDSGEIEQALQALLASGSLKPLKLVHCPLPSTNWAEPLRLWLTVLVMRVSSRAKAVRSMILRLLQARLWRWRVT